MNQSTQFPVRSRIVAVDTAEKRRQWLKAEKEREIAEGARNRARATLSRKVNPATPAAVSRIGYYAAVANCCPPDGARRFSGSSLNRQIRDEERRLASPWLYVGLPEAEQEKVKREAREPGYHSLNDRTKSIVKNRATAFMRACKGKKVFATLTFIGDVSDQLGKKILSRFLDQLRRQYRNLQYLWVAERQNKTTGRIHFHVIINQRIDLVKFNTLWIKQQLYKNQVQCPRHAREKILQAIEKGEVQKLLNPLDLREIVSHKNAKNRDEVAAYLTKYITKNESGEFNCLAWHCSRGVSRLVLKTVCSKEVMQRVQCPTQNFRVDRKTGEVYPPKPAPTENPLLYQVWRINQPENFKDALREMEQLNAWILHQRRSVFEIVEYMKTRLTEDELRRLCCN